MKKNLIALYVIAGMTVAACTNNSEQPELKPGNGSSDVFTAVIGQETRTSLDANNNVVWSNDDAITVFKMGGGVQDYSIVEGAGTTTAQFIAEGDVVSSGALDQNYAIYPSGDYTFENKVFQLDLSYLAKQAVNTTSFAEEQSLMTAKSGGSELKFYNALSMLQVNLCAYDLDAFTIKGIKVTADQPLAGKAAIDMSGETPVLTIAEDGSKEISLDIPEEGIVMNGECNHDLKGGHNFYILLPAGTYTNFRIAVDMLCVEEGTAADGGVEKFLTLAKSYETITLERSKINTFHRSIDALFSVNGTIYSDILEGYAANKNAESLEVKLERERVLYWPFFESKELQASEISLPINIDGQNKTVEFADPDGWPILINANDNPVTLKDLNCTGEISLMYFGVNSKTEYNTTYIDNLNMSNMKVNYWAAIRTATFVTGKSTISNSTITGSTISENDPWNGHSWKDVLHAPSEICYDLGINSQAIVNIYNSTIGKIYMFEHSNLYINEGSTVDYIFAHVNWNNGGTNGLTLNNGSYVKEIDSKSYASTRGSKVTINSGAKVDVFNIRGLLTSSASNSAVMTKISAGATIGKINFYNGKETVQETYNSVAEFLAVHPECELTE